MSKPYELSYQATSRCRSQPLFAKTVSSALPCQVCRLVASDRHVLLHCRFGRVACSNCVFSRCYLYLYNYLSIPPRKLLAREWPNVMIAGVRKQRPGRAPHENSPSQVSDLGGSAATCSANRRAGLSEPSGPGPSSPLRPVVQRTQRRV